MHSAEKFKKLEVNKLDLSLFSSSALTVGIYLDTWLSIVGLFQREFSKCSKYLAKVSDNTHFIVSLKLLMSGPRSSILLLIYIVLSCLCVFSGGVTVTYSYTGAVQTFVVPSNVYSLSIDMTGAAGGIPSGSSLAYGYGARIVTTISVTPLQTLNIYIGGKPADATTSSSNQAGGYNGGGTGYNGNAGGNGGGGGSDIRNGTSLASRVVVAGGGGGVHGSCSSTGGQGGLNGVTGCSASGTPGDGGTQTAGGAAGGGSATDGALGQGGQCDLGVSCGGGGGGYYGGGGGSTAGGGGGSSHSSGTSTTVTTGYNSGSGSLTITYIAQPTSQPSRLMLV